jgi:hypothetical protein
MERRPGYLRHKGVDCTVKLAERGSVDSVTLLLHIPNVAR